MTTSMNQELTELKDLKELKQVQRELAGYHRSFKYIVQFVQHLNEFGTSFPSYNPVENISIQTFFSARSAESPARSAAEDFAKPDSKSSKSRRSTSKSEPEYMYNTVVKFTLWHIPIEILYKKDCVTVYMSRDETTVAYVLEAYRNPSKHVPKDLWKWGSTVLDFILVKIKGFFPPEKDNSEYV